MTELIDKKRTEAKVFLIARLFIDRPDREIELVKAVIHRCCEEIDKQPTIEPEVRQGRWNYRHEDDWCYCTACGTDAEGSDGECLETDYCPNCGARMDATEEGGAQE